MQPRIFMESFCSEDVENIIYKVGRETGFGSYAIGDLYEALVDAGRYTESKLRQLAIEASDKNISLSEVINGIF
jgi:hypothetical protein